ncbi:hypothetical protein ACIHCV_36570 [Streptomyces sp. NPDC051956]|uniref:hypothetical protein n=1 Tax=Streptomyces sp. NPDC051956 TaxID=3365677 RepID=UPI0037CD4066
MTRGRLGVALLAGGRDRGAVRLAGKVRALVPVGRQLGLNGEEITEMTRGGLTS